MADLLEVLEKKQTALRVGDLAELLNVNERSVYRWAAKHKIPSFKIGGTVRFNPATVAEWLRNKFPVPVPDKRKRSIS